MKMNNLCFGTLFGFIACVAVCSGNAAEIGRSRMGNMQQNGANVSRMPTLPVMTMNTIGNPAVGTVTSPVDTNQLVTPTPPQPTPPAPTPECADGGVKNTEYTVSMCMSDLRLCVDSGAVEGGLHGLFNDEYFLRVLNGNLKICQNVVDNCMEIRQNCRRVYRTSRSVWADFRSRILWPEYYNFVLYKTGLTPNQAKKTCTRLGARWDAVNAECLTKVVAYNKNSPISNEWLFGIAGNGKDAEAWLKMGDSFTCNKSLFGFSLLNDTATVAATAIPGGAVVGGVIGGVAAKAKRNKVNGDPCESKDFRKELGKNIEEKHYAKVLTTYLYKADRDEESGEYNEEGPANVPYAGLEGNFYNMDKATCGLIMDLYSKIELYEDAIDYCTRNVSLAPDIAKLFPTVAHQACTVVYDNNQVCIMKTQAKLVCENVPGASEQIVNAFNEKCMFVPLQLGYTVANDNNPLCGDHDGSCRNYLAIESDLARLSGLLDTISATVGDKKEPASVGKGILVGAGIGAATGGLATGITALIESNNIRCVVGNDWASVALNKSYTIDSVKDFYVKKGFSLPDTVIPTTVVVDKNSWGVACSEYAGNPDDCASAQVVYKHGNIREIISAACEVSGNMCVMNEAVAQTHLPQLIY